MQPESLSLKSPEQTIKILLQCALFYLTDKDNALEFIEKSRQKLATTENITKSQFNELTATVWDVLRTFLRSTKDERSASNFTRQIMQISKDPPVSKEFAENLLENLQTERQMLELKFQEKTTTGVSVAEISYRFDISSVGEDSSVPIKPVLIFDLLLSNGKRITFRCPWSMYHRLRFATARLLKEIQFLETRQIIIR